MTASARIRGSNPAHQEPTGRKNTVSSYPAARTRQRPRTTMR